MEGKSSIPKAGAGLVEQLWWAVDSPWAGTTAQNFKFCHQKTASAEKFSKSGSEPVSIAGFFFFLRREREREGRYTQTALLAQFSSDKQKTWPHPLHFHGHSLNPAPAAEAKQLRMFLLPRRISLSSS